MYTVQYIEYIVLYILHYYTNVENRINFHYKVSKYINMFDNSYVTKNIKQDVYI